MSKYIRTCLAKCCALGGGRGGKFQTCNNSTWLLCTIHYLCTILKTMCAVQRGVKLNIECISDTTMRCPSTSHNRIMWNTAWNNCPKFDKHKVQSLVVPR